MLNGKGLLTPLQRDFCTLFAGLPDQAQFYLTGGTALTEFYLGHRLSFDLDFFTAEQPLIGPTAYQLEALSGQAGLHIAVVRRFAAYVEFLVSRGDDTLKVDLALDSPFRFAAPVLSTYGVWVNPWEDLRVDKLLAYYGRGEPRDAVDLYFILRETPLDLLLAQAAQKDPGFDGYWLAVALNRAATFPDELARWPVKLLLPLEPAALKQQFQALALDLLARAIRPAP